MNRENLLAAGKSPLHDPLRGVTPTTALPVFAASDPLVDPFARAISYVRISVTDRCNLRCVYCMPEEGNRFVPEASLMSADEIERIARVLVGLGVRKIRLTGGEPTLRPDLVDIVGRLSRLGLPGGLALSTNGVLFAPMAERLVAAGLDRINISLDALDDAGFRLMGRRDRLAQVLAALDAALGLPFRSVKLNTVVIRGLNDGEIPRLVALARARPVEVRFIEFMPFGTNDWTAGHLMTAEEIRAVIARTDRLVPLDADREPGPAEVFTADGWAGRVGFVTPISDRFCARCNRMRVTADGRVKACLFGLEEVDLLGPLRDGASDPHLVGVIREAVWRKEERHPLHPSMRKETLILHGRNMNQVGG